MTLLDTNKKIVSEFVAATNKQDWKRFNELVHPEVARHSSTFGQPLIQSVGQLQTFHQQELEVFPDLQETILLMLAEEDKVAALISFEGTQTGKMGKYPASGKSMKANFICIFRVERERIREIWVEYDTLTGLVQLGHFNPDI